MLDVSLFFHECSVVTSKLDPNYNWFINSINICLFILLCVWYVILEHEDKNVRAELT